MCEGGGASVNIKRTVLVQAPLNCELGAVPPPKPGFSLGIITSTGSAPGTADTWRTSRSSVSSSAGRLTTYRQIR